MTGLKNEQRQLIERIGNFEADQNQRCDHQIKAKMHEGLETIYLAACADLAAGRQPNSIVSTRAEGLRRRESVPSVHIPSQMPWKILIPHNPTTIADTSGAAVNTLSKEATLMLLSASQPR